MNDQYDLETVMKALRTAEATGNAEDAKRLAVIADRLSKEEKILTPQIEERSPGFMPSLNRGIATTLGAPVDLTNAILGKTFSTMNRLLPEGNRIFPDVSSQPFGGKENISDILRKLNIPVAEKEPETPFEYVGTGIGEAAGALLPMTGITKSLSLGAGLTGQVSRTIMESVIKHPVFSSIAELSAGAGAGAGRKIGEVHPKTKPYAEMVGGVIGGAAPGLIAYHPARAIYRGGKYLLKRASLPFAKQGREYRVGKFLQNQVVSPEETLGRLGKGTISKMPPALATKEKRIIALYRDLSSKDPVKDAEAIEKITKSMVALADEMKRMGYGSPELLKDIIEKRVTALDMSMNDRVLKAMAKAQNRLDSLPVASRRANESIIVKNSLNDVMIKERQNVRDIWKSIPENIMQAEVDPKNARLIYKNLLKESSEAQLGDFPQTLRKSFIFKNKPGKPITVNEMQGLRSKLLEIERNASAITNPRRNLNTARICGEVADAILDDIDSIDDHFLKQALNATRNFKNRFEKGIVGKILGTDRTNAPTIEPEVVLDIAIARNPEQAAVNIAKITPTPEAKRAVSRYITRSFTDYALDNKTNTLIPSKVNKWVKNNEAILDQFPELREQFLDASKAQELAIRTKTLMDARRLKLRDPRISTASAFLKTDIDKEISVILKSRNPTLTARNLARMASKDPTGEALDGLRAGFVEYILDHSYIGRYNELGEKTISGNAMHGLLNKNRNILKEIFPKDQLSRMDKIAREYSSLEMFWDKTTAPKFEVEDTAANLITLWGRIGAAKVGNRMGGGDIQTPGFMSGAAKKFTTRLNRYSGSQLLSDAILSEDDTLLKTLLLPVEKPGRTGQNWIENLKNLKIIDQRLNAWLLGTGNRVLQDLLEEEKNDKK